MPARVITISRQRGSGADTIAALVARQLQMPLYDHQVLARAAAKAGVTEDTIAAAEVPQGFLDRMFEVLAQTPLYSPEAPIVLPPVTLTGLMATRAEFRAAIEQVIRTIAATGPAVIVGHAGGQVALRDHPDVLRVFIHGTVGQWVQRMMSYGRLSRADAERDVRERDEERVTFFQRHYDLN